MRPPTMLALSSFACCPHSRKLVAACKIDRLFDLEIQLIKIAELPTVRLHTCHDRVLSAHDATDAITAKQQTMHVQLPCLCSPSLMLTCSHAHTYSQINASYPPHRNLDNKAVWKQHSRSMHPAFLQRVMQSELAACTAAGADRGSCAPA